MVTAVRSSKRKVESMEKSKDVAPAADAPSSPAPRKQAATRKSTTTKKPAATKKATKAAPKKSTKKAEEKENEDPVPTKRASSKASAEPIAKKARTAAPAKAAKAEKPAKVTKPAKPAKVLPIITTTPQEVMQVLMFGTGENGELGLGPLPNAKTVSRPRINPYLDMDTVGVVALSLGGMHGLALTKEGKVYSWGVNDLQALGRDTKADEKIREINAESDSDDEVEESMNKLESTPMEVTGFPPGTVITKIAAGDSISIALTNTGKVFGWGTFRTADGVLGFSERKRIQDTPAEIPGLKNIVSAVCGTDHVIVLDDKGHVYAWGNGQQNQLGRRVVERTRIHGLTPRPIVMPGRKKIKAIYSGHYHAFAVDTDGAVWAWGLNNYGQTGVYSDNGSDPLLTIPSPMIVDKLSEYDVAHMASGSCHTAVVTKDGDLLCWGRMDAHQAGASRSKVADQDIIKDVAGKDRILVTPTKISEQKFATVECGLEHSIAIDTDGAAWSWGFGEMFQVGHGPPSRDIEEPTKIENSKTKLVFLKAASCGGNFSLVAGVPHEDLE